MVVDDLLEEVEQVRVLLHVLLPLRALEVFAQLHDVFKKLVAEVLAHLIHRPHRQEVHLRIDVHGHRELALPHSQRLVLYHQVLVVQLHILVVDLARVAQFLLQVFAVVDGASEKE